MKNEPILLTSIVSAVVIPFVSSCYNSHKQTKNLPNIIICLTDDQGIGDIGYLGNKDIKTPVLDSLSQNAVRFNQFYVSPVSAPTRSSLMTGRYSLRTGIHDTNNGGATMASEEITLAEQLKKAGYTNGIFGKWHLGDNYPYRPQDQGFDSSFVLLSGGMGQVGDIYNFPKGDSRYFNPIIFKNGKPTQTTGYCSDVFTNEAINFIKKNKNKQFFAYLAFNAPHYPLQVPQEYYNLYKDIKPDGSNYGLVGGNNLQLTEDNIEDARKVYGMLTNIDDNIGKLMSLLKKENLDKNTLFIFLSDNGPAQDRYRLGLRGKKSDVFEGGVKSPCFFYYPSHFNKVKELNLPAAHFDIFPTICELCNINLPKDRKIDGISLLPWLNGSTEAFPKRTIFYNWARRFPEPYINVAAREGNYKLVGNGGLAEEENPFELFNISIDPYEMDDIKDKNEDEVLKLQTELDLWLSEMLASPNLNKTLPAYIGFDNENPVILNRNDALGSPGIWTQRNIYLYWDILVKEAANYDIECVFFEPVPAEGNMKIQIGTFIRTVKVEEEKTEIWIKNVPLKAGTSKLIPWYNKNRKMLTPFYIKIFKR